MAHTESFDRYLDANQMYSFEGNRGIKRLTQITQEVCGYRSLIDFLEDNPVAIEAIVNCIREVDTPEWAANLSQLVPDDEPNDESDE